MLCLFLMVAGFGSRSHIDYRRSLRYKSIMSQLCCGTLALRPPFHAAFLCPTAAGASRGITFKTLQQPYAASGGTTCSTRPRRQPRGGSLPVSALRGVESFEADFELTEQQSSTLNELLNSDMFCKQASASFFGLPSSSGPHPAARLEPPLLATPHPQPGPSLRLSQPSLAKGGARLPAA